MLSFSSEWGEDWVRVGRGYPATKEARRPAYPVAMAGCRSKFARAQVHLADFYEQLGVFFEDGEPYGAVGKIEEAGWYVFRIEERKKIPLDLCVILGEGVHQSRSTLDHIMRQLAIAKRNGRHPPESTRYHFPVHAKPNDAAWAINRLKDEIPEDWREVLDEIQPRDAPDDSLATVHRFWNTDKHMIVIPAPRADALTFGHAQFRVNADAGQVIEERRGHGISLEAGAEIARVKIAPKGPNPRVEMYVVPPFHLELPSPGAPYRGKTGIPTLKLFSTLNDVQGFVHGLIGVLGGWDQLPPHQVFRDYYTTPITTLRSEKEAAAFGFVITERRWRWPEWVEK